MESATHPETKTEAPEAAARTAKAGAAAETFDVHRPADGSVIRTVAIDSPAEVAETVARVRAAQPAWEAIGFDGRAPLARGAARLDARQPRPARRLMQAETGKVRADAALEAFYCLDAINFWGDQGAEATSPTRRHPAHAAAAREAQQDRLPAVRGRRHDQPLELPADPLGRRRDPGADGRRRGRDQAVAS